MDTAAPFPGMRRFLQISATDYTGKRRSSETVGVTSSDTAIAAIDRLGPVPVTVGGRTIMEWHGAIRLLSPGTVTLAADWGGVKQTLDLTVRPLPAVSAALVVDSLAVNEFYACDAACRPLWAPVVRLHDAESADNVALQVVAVSFTLPRHDPGYFCEGARSYQPGQTDDLVYYETGGYVYSPFVIFGAVGDELPDEPVVARIIFRDQSGAYGLTQASGPIVRSGQQPILPLTDDDGLLGSWRC